MKIKITSDSTCDLSQELIQQFNIGVKPLYVVKGEETCLDGVTITPDQMYEFIDSTGKHCSTAALNVNDYAEFFKENLEGYDALIHVNISSGFSSCYQNACIAAGDFENVYVIDSKNLSTGHGHIVLAAAEMAAEGAEPRAIVDAMNELAPKVDASFILDRLDYMAKGGRCSAVVAFGANLLKLKPCIEVVDGKMVVGKKYRGPYERCLAQYITERLNAVDDIENHRIFITHSGTSEANLQLAEKLVREHQGYENINITRAGCTVSCHCGANTIGILYIHKNPKKV